MVLYSSSILFLKSSIDPSQLTNKINSHCDTCKALSGGAFTLNQIVPKENLKITKGTPKAYTYYGDSGNCPFSYPHPSTPFPTPFRPSFPIPA